MSTRLEIQNQILVVSVGIAGTPFSLCYASDRVPGRASAYDLVIPEGDGAVGGLKRIELELEVAGRSISERLVPRRGGIRFRWDGRDGEGRAVRGPHPAQVRVGYVSGGLLGSERTLWREQELALGAFDARALGLGGWTLSAQHAFDPVGRVLYLGKGGRRSRLELPDGRDGAGDQSERPRELTIPSKDGNRLHVFDASGRHLRTLYGLAGGLLWRLEYDEAGRLLALVDADGNATRIERDEEGSLKAIVAPSAQRTSLSANGEGFLGAIGDPLGAVARCEYSDDGLLVGLTDAEGNVCRYAYDEEGRLVREQPASDGPTMLARARTRTGTRVALLTALNREYGYEVERMAQGGQERRNRCCGTRAVVERVSAEGARTMTYPDGLIVTSQIQPDPRLGSAASLLKESVALTPGGLTSTISATRSVAQRHPDDPTSLEVQVDTFSVNGRVYKTVYASRAESALLTQTSPAGRTRTVVIDRSGRVQQVQFESFEPAYCRHDERGRLISISVGTGATARTIGFDYDSGGNLAMITDPLGRSIRLTFDAAGHLLRQVLADEREIAFAYDGNANLIALTRPGRSDHRFDYEANHLITQSTLPAPAQVPCETRYRYDAERRLTAIERPGGATIEFSYDEAGSLGSIVTPDGRIEHIYDRRTGQRCRTSGPGEIGLAYEYDGPLLTKEVWSGRVAGAVRHFYNNDFRPASLAVVGEPPIGFEYDPDGLVVRAGDLCVEHDLRGRARRATLSALSSERRFSGFGELVHERIVHRDRILYEAKYGHDALGRITERRETIEGETHAFRYVYDLHDHLIEVVRDDVTVARYAYDKNGNRVHAEDETAMLQASYDAQDRLLALGQATYAYTAAGELLERSDSTGATEYNYDLLGNLLAVILPDGRRIEYVIDGRGRRVGKRVDGNLVKGFLYQDDLRLIAELDGANRVVSRFVYAGNTNVPAYLIRDGTTYWIASDHLGSARLIVDAANAQIVQRLDYDAFGNVLRDTNPGFQPFGFAGGLYDEDTRLVRFGARDYEALTGRWTAEDPIGFAGGDTNLYAYVLNDPVNLVDPSGLQMGWIRKTLGRARVIAEIIMESVRAVKVGSTSRPADISRSPRTAQFELERETQKTLRRRDPGGAGAAAVSGNVCPGDHEGTIDDHEPAVWEDIVHDILDFFTPPVFFDPADELPGFGGPRA